MKGNYRHGMRHTRIYNIWRSMRQRCSNPKCRNYKHYGGRGIAVCKEWNEDFAAFLEWAMSNGYNERLTLDRIDVNGNYCPDNCSWQTYKVQENNKTNNRILLFNERKHTLTEWSEITGISEATLWARLKNGWSVERALTERPIIGKNQYSA